MTAEATAALTEMPDPAVNTMPPNPLVFTAHDRCDQCGAQAYTKVVLASGVLLFCGHHGKANMDALAKVALEIFESPVTS